MMIVDDNRMLFKPLQSLKATYDATLVFQYKLLAALPLRDASTSYWKADIESQRGITMQQYKSFDPE